MSVGITISLVLFITACLQLSWAALADPAQQGYSGKRAMVNAAAAVVYLLTAVAIFTILI